MNRACNWTCLWDGP